LSSSTTGGLDDSPQLMPRAEILAQRLVSWMPPPPGFVPFRHFMNGKSNKPTRPTATNDDSSSTPAAQGLAGFENIEWRRGSDVCAERLKIEFQFGMRSSFLDGE